MLPLSRMRDALRFDPVELVHAVRTRRNAPSRAPLDERAFWSLYASEGRVLEAAPAALAAGAEPALLIVLTTYQRPAACAALLTALHAALAAEPPQDVRLLVLNDRGSADYTEARRTARALFGAKLSWLDARERLGKPGFWRAYQVAFLAARALSPSHALFLQDDLLLAPTTLRDARTHWDALAHDARRRVLYLFSDASDERFGRWTFFPRRTVAPGLRLTQWFDLQAFMVDRAFFELLDYRMIPVHPNRWTRRPSISSGVGRQLTVRLRRRANVYQTSPALVQHGAHASEMNPAARARRRLDNTGG